MVRHIIVILSLVQCLASNNNNNNNNTYATILFYYSTPLKSNVQQIVRKQMAEVRLTAWISCVRYCGGNYNSHQAPEANCSFSEWVYVNDSDRKIWYYLISIVVFKTTTMGMVCVFEMVFIEMKLLYKCFCLLINNDKKN